MGTTSQRAKDCSLIRFWSVIVLLVGFVGQGYCSSLGLLDQPQTFPWTVGLTPVVLEEAGGLAVGTSRIRTSVLWFNTYRQYGQGEYTQQLVDMEGLIETLSWAWSPGSGWELRAQVQGWELGGGVMDPLLAAFHGFLGVPNQGREGSGMNLYRDYLQGVLDDESPGNGLTQMSAGIRGFSGPWSCSAWVKPPVPGHLGWGWSDRWAGGIAVGWGDRWPLADLGIGLRWGGTAALVVADPDRTWLVPTRGLSGQGGWYGILEILSGPRFLVQGSYTADPRSAEGYLSQGSGLLTVGSQIPLGFGLTLEPAFNEEFLTWATAEVGFQFGLGWNF